MAEIPTPSTGYSASSGERPLGVTILALLQMIGGVIGIFGGATSMLAAMLLGPLGLLFVIIGAVLLIMGLLGLIVGWGLWGLKSWAWMWAMIVNIINIILAIVQLNIISLIIPLIIVLYLNQSDIKSRFR
ncbi:hypothetical protein EU528_08955 [Candidatus Thorarchaeota archaeon]|nr:MAG: hypothetical protein EU528_08955 [Candidatus Thorarchaeota archaeon]